RPTPASWRSIPARTRRTSPRPRRRRWASSPGRRPVATGLLGGTFDPIHMAHLIMAEAAIEDLDLDRVILVPSGVPPHKTGRPISAAEHRIEMVRRAISDDRRLEVSELETGKSSPSYTVDTVREFGKRLPEGERLHFIMGADSLAQFFTWKDPLALLAACEFAVAPRPGVEIGDADPRIASRAHVLRAPMIGISSSDIRKRVAEGRTIRYLVPPSVSAYIAEKKLYT
ncbi:MAG: nicotinate-nucleotide adenylyltransferase, partial [Candidatus Eisenbacteria bacterium]|nr:nicotinate-nucleotide adenylyltransferase [Candidatus Eisenbacteria bacterium]